MKTINEEIKELFTLSGNEFENRLQYLKETYTGSEDKKKLSDTILSEMDNTIEDMKQLGAQMDEMISLKEQLKEVSEIVSLSYIAKHYFGKTRSWLYQRLYGYSVRGKVYNLNEKEKETLNAALQDISKRIGSVSVI
ncbi:DUF5053 domain-containing protein [Bacteroides sp. 51]|uniref:DUF5053 domain-containing protein n=1 Tax=Bacteroides sp. 51 TaxID=2302938 RepID=UPI0013D6A618|nr:DUF5053 domain-containing protein [Bacteroides sp. 51]NDV81912.1 DUF5053 domain-containing protein [Bacteroides sp. 51]